MPPVVALHVIGAFFLNGRGQVGLTYRRFCAFDGRAVACFPTPPLGGYLSTSLPRDAACDALHLIGAFFAMAGARSRWTHRRFCAFDGRAVARSSYFPLSAAIYSTFLPVMPPVMRCT